MDINSGFTRQQQPAKPLPHSKVFSSYAVAVAYMAYIEAAERVPKLIRWGRNGWRVVC
ncbi:hypothetical protein G1C94_0426 [Bifidobacterium sp. DSM 109963]|uniref:Uncharacterized protein n=1 Tax=Bifidobacterium panos TaxID=2675321 RepID=A0ABX1SVE9_9BIFI|nr:hypothetical protein [Bifidobacterium sp. DSM 109963]